MAKRRARSPDQPEKKSQESTQFTCATTFLQIAFQYEVNSQSYGAPKLQKFELARFRDSHLGVLREKNHLDVGPVERCRVYYKGEGGGFPQVRAMVILVCPCCPWFVLAPKVLQLRIVQTLNQLFSKHSFRNAFNHFQLKMPLSIVSGFSITTHM